MWLLDTNCPAACGTIGGTHQAAPVLAVGSAGDRCVHSFARAKLDIIAAVCGHPLATAEIGAMTALYAVTQDGLSDPRDWMVIDDAAEAVSRVISPDIDVMLERIRGLSPVWLAALTTGALYADLLRSDPRRAEAFADALIDRFDSATAFALPAPARSLPGAGLAGKEA